jgi:hypothetical protein
VILEYLQKVGFSWKMMCILKKLHIFECFFSWFLWNDLSVAKSSI